MYNSNDNHEQLSLLGDDQPLVHYFDANGALRTGRMVRRIQKGKRKGAIVVIDHHGRKFIPKKIRNIDYDPKS